MTTLIARLGPSYLIAQGIGGIVWWIGLLGSERVRGWFVPEGWEAARTLLIADVVLFGLGSIVVGLAITRQSAFAGPLSWALTGVVAYATLVSVSWLFDPIGHWLGLVFMVPSLVLTVVIASSREVS